MSHASSTLAPSAWLGVALLVWGLEGLASGRGRLGALGLAWVLMIASATPWLYTSARLHFAVGGLPALGLTVGAWVVIAGAMLLPAVPLALWRVLPPRWWLPLAWVLAEISNERITGFGLAELLCSQAEVRPVLRMVGWLGWEGALLALLLGVGALGAALRHQSAGPLWAPVALAWLIGALPPLPDAGSDLLRGIGVVQDGGAPVQLGDPGGLELLVWPEGATGVEPRLAEGAQRGAVTLGSFAMDGPEHLVGLGVRSAVGSMNAVAALDSDGSIRWARGKAALVPVAERAFLGIPALAGGYVPGREPAVTRVAARQVIPLVCYEALQRHIARRGREQGGELLVVVASDESLAHSALALRQVEAALVLRAVDLGVPAVRASRGGRALVVGSRRGVVMDTSNY